MENIFRRGALFALLCTFSLISFAQETDYGIYLKSGQIHAKDLKGPNQLKRSQLQRNLHDGSYYLILQFSEIPKEDVQQEIKAAGVELLGYLPNYAFISKVPQSFNLVDLEPFGLQAVAAVRPEHKLSRELADRNFPDHALAGNEVLISLQPYPGISEKTLINSLIEGGYTLVFEPDAYHLVTVQVNENRLQDLASLSAVMYLEPAEAPSYPEGLRGRTSHRANLLSSAPGTGYDGTNVVVGIADDGGISHVDFQGRLTDFNTSQGGTHGDMVSGIAVGSGNIDPTKVGMATGSYLNMYSISGYPHVINAISNYNNLGTVVTSTSYSQGCGGLYDGTSQSLDADVFTQNVLLHVFSAGNSASSSCSSIYGSLVASDGYRYGNITGGRKAAKSSIATANLEYDDDRTLSSSRGPCEDGRLKPDIAAHGTGQLTTAPNNGYQTGGGTSAAAPGIAGVSAMLYQAYKDNNGGAEPKSSLIKGIMLNSADDLGRPGPDYDFGWGRVNAKRAVEGIENTQYINSSISQGGSNSHNISVPAGLSKLKVMVYWLDPAGSSTAAKALVNDLNMQLSTPGGTTYNPWILSKFASIDSLQFPAWRGIDDRNNMEQVTIDNPSGGTFTVNVSGNAVPQGPQAYHVVYSFVQNGITVTYPAGGESVVGGTSEVLRWDANGTAGNFTLEYSTNNGSSWTNIASGIAGSQRFYNWTPPSVATGNALIRVSRSGQSDQSDSGFNIIGVPASVSVSSAGATSASISWTAVSGANGYDVYALGTRYMEIVGSTSGTSFTLTGLTNGASNWYSVRAKNSSGITGRRAIAINYTHFGGGCLSTISAFPYSESFESNFGNWQNESGDDLDWTRLSGSTGSSNTGPSAAADGSFYIYTEASSPNFPSKTALLRSPCIDLSGLSAPRLNFQYHMYGAAMGTLDLEVSTDGGASFIGTAWSENGDQGNQWNAATVDLTPWTGQNDVVLRWVGTTGTSFTSDMAVDDIEIFEDASACTTINTYPYNEGFESGFGAWSQQGGDDFDWSRRSGSTPSVNTGPTAANSGSFYVYTESSSPNYPSKTALLVSPCFDLSGLSNPEISFAYHMYGATMGTLDLELSTNGGASWAGTLWSENGDQGNQWLNETISLSAWAGSSIRLRWVGTTTTSFTSDMSVDDISIGEGSTSSCASATGYQENFDAMTLCGNTVFNCITDGSCALSGGWVNASGDDIDWSVDNAATPSSSTGPSSDHTSGSGNFLYTESSSCYSQTAILESPCLAISSSSGQALSFWYHMLGNSVGSLSLSVSTDGGSTFGPAIWTRSATQGSNWLQASVSLNSYLGQDAIFRFTAVTGTSWQSDIAIDDVSIGFVAKGSVAGPAAELSNESSWSAIVYPNPAQGQATLRLSGLESEAHVQVFDAFGRVVRQLRSTPGAAETEVSLDLHNLASGLYSVRVRSGEEVKVIALNVQQ